MDMIHITEMLKLLNRITVSLEDQAKHQQECNDMSRQQNAEDHRVSEEWRKLQIQWHEESQARETALHEQINQQRAEQMAREDQWRKENTEANERHVQRQISAYFQKDKQP